MKKLLRKWTKKGEIQLLTTQRGRVGLARDSNQFCTHIKHGRRLSRGITHTFGSAQYNAAALLAPLFCSFYELIAMSYVRHVIFAATEPCFVSSGRRFWFIFASTKSGLRNNRQKLIVTGTLESRANRFKKCRKSKVIRLYQMYGKEKMNFSCFYANCGADRKLTFGLHKPKVKVKIERFKSCKQSTCSICFPTSKSSSCLHDTRNSFLFSSFQPGLNSVCSCVDHRTFGCMWKQRPVFVSHQWMNEWIIQPFDCVHSFASSCKKAGSDHEWCHNKQASSLMSPAAINIEARRSKQMMGNCKWHLLSRFASIVWPTGIVNLLASQNEFQKK